MDGKNKHGRKKRMDGWTTKELMMALMNGRMDGQTDKRKGRME